MDTLNIMYIIMTAVGGLFLALSIFGGEADTDLELNVGDADFDISNAEVTTDSPSVFSLRTISVFLLAAGLGGMVGNFNGYGTITQLFFALITGVIVAALFLLVMKFMYGMQGTSNVNPRNLIGELGIITIPTTSTGVAQVRVATTNGSIEFTCVEKTGQKLTQNEYVKITEVFGLTVTVEKQ